jgi:phosphonate transport system ATP-binding protein
MLRLENLTKIYGTLKAVDNVSLDTQTGEMTGIIGSSGAGKSTLLRLINRLADPTEGRIYWNTTEITALRGSTLLDWRANCAMIFQQFNLVERLNVITNVLMGRLRSQGFFSTLLMHFSREERAMAIEALDCVELLDQVLQRCDTLSGGQQQRVSIARAMIQHPEIILADEPIASLDPRSAKKVMCCLRDINERTGITVLTSLHDLASARTYCDRIIGMARGRVVFDGPPDALDEATVREIYGEKDAEEELAHDAERAALAAAQRRQQDGGQKEESVREVAGVR